MVDGDDTPRRAFLAAAGTALSAAVAGCNGDEGETTTSTTTGRTTTTTPEQLLTGQVLELSAEYVGTLDPVAATTPSSEAVVENLFDGLTTFPDGRPEPELGLAEDVRVSPDATTYTFDLADARFHDGTPVTADDVVYSFERLAASPNSRWSDLILETLGIEHETADGEGGGPYRPGSLGVSAVDEGTVELRLAEPFPAALRVLAYPQFSVVPEGIVGDVEGYGGDREYESFATDPVGPGPFELVAWRRDEQVACRRFPDWHGGDVAVDGIRWRLLGDATDRYEYGLEGPGDLVAVLDDEYDPGKVDVERTDDAGRAFGTYGPVGDGRTLEYLSVPLVDTAYVGFDMTDVPKPVRRAVALATDQHALVDRALDGRATPAYHLTPPAIYPRGEYAEHARRAYPHGYAERRVDQARSVMDTAGYGGDGAYELRWTQYNAGPLEAIAERVADWLEPVDVDLQVETVPYDSLLRRGREGDLEAYAFRAVPEWPAPDAFLAALDPPRTDPRAPDPASFLDWPRAAATGMADAADRAGTAAETVAANPAPSEFARETRQESYVEIEEANWEDVGILPLYHRTEERFAGDRARIDPFGGTGSHRQAFDGARIRGE